MNRPSPANRRDNILRAVRFEKPEYIPMIFKINAACWNHYGKEELLELIEAHPFLFPDCKMYSQASESEYAPFQKADMPFTDGFGCVWQTTEDGITGVVTGHPLQSWDNFAAYQPPDGDIDSGRGPINWDQVAETITETRAVGGLVKVGLRHGHTFQTLADIRGFENLLIDMADAEPKLDELIKMVEDFNVAIVEHYVQLGAEWMSYPEDLGMQKGPMISPKLFRKYIKPSYRRLMAPARDAGCIVHMHSDGDIRDLADDLIDGGVDVLNLQDLVNGIDWIKDNLTGRICIDLDIDRQQITCFGGPGEIDALIREEVEKLATKQGGLMMIYGLYPGVALENVKALADAMEKYAGYYS